MTRRAYGDFVLTWKQQQAWDLHEAGASYAAISRVMGVGRSTVQGYIEGARAQKELAQAHGLPWRRDDPRVREREHVQS